MHSHIYCNVLQKNLKHIKLHGRLKKLRSLERICKMFRIYKENRFLSGFSINAIFLGTFFGAGMGYSSFDNCRCATSSIKWLRLIFSFFDMIFFATHNWVTFENCCLNLSSPSLVSA